MSDSDTLPDDVQHSEINSENSISSLAVTAPARKAKQPNREPIQLRYPKKDGDPPIWTRQRPKEGRKPYAAFCLYRDGGFDRSYAKVAEELKRSETLIGRWGARYCWVERIDAFDANEDLRRRIRNEVERVRMNERHINISQIGQQKVIEALRELQASQIKPRDLPRFADIFFKAERQARGEPTVIVQTKNEGDLYDENLEAARETFAESESLFPEKTPLERANSIAVAYGVKPEELLQMGPSSDAVN